MATALTVQNSEIVYQHEGQTLWTFAIDKIKLIAEYTTSAGPMADDWFFVFAETVEIREFRHISSLDINHTQFWADLGRILNCKMAPHLFASTSWASSVMYPIEFQGHEAFEVVKSEPKTRGFWRRLSGNKYDERIELTEEIKQFFD